MPFATIALVRCFVSLILLATLARTAEIPKTLISESEAEPIRSAIVRKEAWTVDAVRRLRAEADRHMKEGPYSVTSDRPANTPLDPHDYYSEAPYWWPNPDNPSGPYIRKEGQVYPGRFTANRAALNQMVDSVFTLGAAAFFLNDSHYAHRAARIIRTWFIDPKTRMNPNLEHAQTIRGVNGGQGGAFDGRAFIRAIQGMEFLSQTEAWSDKDQAAVRKWFEEYLRWLTRSPIAEEDRASGNDHTSWWAAQAAAVATFVDNDHEAQAAFRFYRDRVFPHQVKPDAQKDESRFRSQVSNLGALTTLCRIAQVHGVNLWSLRAKNGATLGTMIDALDPALSDPHRLAREQIPDFATDSVFFLAFAGMGMNRPDYVALYRKIEHPDTAWLNVIDLLVSRWESSGHQTRH